MKDFTQEFNKFKQKLVDRENFAFTRFSDGECFILQNKRLVLGDGFYVTGDKAGANTYGPEERKEFDPVKHQHLRQQLQQSFDHRQQNYFRGIPSQQDSAHIDFQCDRTEPDLTFANLFINANYKRFIEEIVLQIFPNRDIVYVVNERAELSGLPFEIKRDFRIGENCMICDTHIISEVLEYLKDKRNYIVLLSAASLSNLVIHKCFEKNSNNTFLDIGSSLNPYLGKDMKSCLFTRDYLREYWLGEKTHYGNQIDVW